MNSREFAVVVPVKQPSRGKSRLSTVKPRAREDLVVGFALDTESAALATPGVRAVLAVTDDVRLATALQEQGCAVIPDGAVGLNNTLVQAAAETRRRWPGTQPVALLADLPCLQPGALAEALQALPDDAAAFVRDRHGDGTTLYSAPLADFLPRFGADSAAAHATDGAREIVVSAPYLRLDVDDVGDLEAARALGVGPHTAAALRRMGTGAHG